MAKPQPTNPGVDTAYTHATQPTPIDPEADGLYWRLGDNLTTLAERLHQAQHAAGYGPGASDTHIITTNRRSRPPAHTLADGSLADPEVRALRQLRRNAKARLRTLVYWLEDELALAAPEPADVRTDVRNAETAIRQDKPAVG